MTLTHLILTTGSKEGIGSEITSKAMQALKPHPRRRFSIFLPAGSHSLQLGRHWKPIPTAHRDIGHWSHLPAHHVQIVSTRKSAPQTFESATQFCMKDGSTAVVTAPMRKLKDGRGHTEILKDVTGSKKITMAFIGKKFNVCLATTHIPIRDINKSLSPNRVRQVLKATQRLHQLTGSESDPIGILGLNPHAGEHGKISRQDGELYKILQSVKGLSPLSPLLPPDGTFTGKPAYRTYLCWYHDQGLIPFKMAHGLKNGIQVTLGLPFIRTSVDHGTAEDIFGKGIADHRSMLMAIQQAAKLQRQFGNSLIF